MIWSINWIIALPCLAPHEPLRFPHHWSRKIWGCGAAMVRGERKTMGETDFFFFPPMNPTGARKPHFISDFEGWVLSKCSVKHDFSCYKTRKSQQLYHFKFYSDKTGLFLFSPQYPSFWFGFFCVFFLSCFKAYSGKFDIWPSFSMKFYS